jgi:DeoR family transcriptional regulator of aga operon
MRTLVGEQEFARVGDLSDMFGVSAVTVRSDLDVLASRGLVRRVRGGAMPRPAPAERPFEEAEVLSAAEKDAIGALAAGLVSSGDSIIVDVGTTTAAIAAALVQRRDIETLTVFTNSLKVALVLEPAIPRIDVVVTGGTLRALQHSLVDPLGHTILDRLNVDIVFIGCNGVDPEGGVTNVNLPETEIKRVMLTAGRRRVVVADGSKIGRVALAHLCSIDEVDILVTGSSANRDVVAALRERGLDLRLA